MRRRRRLFAHSGQLCTVETMSADIWVQYHFRLMALNIRLWSGWSAMHAKCAKIRTLEFRNSGRTICTLPSNALRHSTPSSVSKNVVSVRVHPAHKWLHNSSALWESSIYCVIEGLGNSIDSAERLPVYQRTRLRCLRGHRTSRILLIIVLYRVPRPLG